MNKSECKKYVKRAYQSLSKQGKEINMDNISLELKKEVSSQCEIYIAYAKLAINDLSRSASKITAKQLAYQIDILPKIYDCEVAINKAKIL